MIDPNHHPRCATQIDNLRCTCDREQAWDAERQRERDHEFTTEKISNGWYCLGGWHIVRTDAYGDDAATDWIVTGCETYARKVHTSRVHGDRRFRVSLCDVDSIHNTKRDARRWICERELVQKLELTR